MQIQSPSHMIVCMYIRTYVIIHISHTRAYIRTCLHIRTYVHTHTLSNTCKYIRIRIKIYASYTQPSSLIPDTPKLLPYPLGPVMSHPHLVIHLLLLLMQFSLCLLQLNTQSIGLHLFRLLHPGEKGGERTVRVRLDFNSELMSNSTPVIDH